MLFVYIYILTKKKIIYADIIAFDIQIPSLGEGGSHFVFSQKYGLLSIGCFRDLNIRYLSFDCDEDREYEDYYQNDGKWRWKSFYNLKIIAGYYNNTKLCSSSMIIDNDTKLINIGGDDTSYGWSTDSQRAHLLNIETKQWGKLKNMKFRRCRCGIYYDDNSANKMLYVVGGDYSSNTSEYYDFIKNEWYKLPNTNCKHLNYPIIWKDDINLLYVASVSSNGLEYIDTRTNDKWKCLYGLYGITLLQKKFCTTLMSKYCYNTFLCK